MKKLYFANALSILIWIAYFGFVYCYDYFDLWMSELDILPTYIQLSLLFFMPIIFVVLNIIFAKKYKTYFISNIILAFCNSAGYYISGVLYYNLISSDDETLLITNIFPIILFVYVFGLTAVGFLIKLLINHLKKGD